MKVGDKVICIKSIKNLIDKNKIYSINYIDDRDVEISLTKDTCYPFERFKNLYHYFYDYFMTLKEFRDKRLNIILDESR